MAVYAWNGEMTYKVYSAYGNKTFSLLQTNDLYAIKNTWKLLNDCCKDAVSK